MLKILKIKAGSFFVSTGDRLFVVVVFIHDGFKFVPDIFPCTAVFLVSVFHCDTFVTLMKVFARLVNFVNLFLYLLTITLADGLCEKGRT